MRQSGRGRRLLARVDHNGRVLRESYRVIANAIREERAITPAAEWLVDNFHVVDEQLREIRDDLPPGYYRELPKLIDGPLAGNTDRKSTRLNSSHPSISYAVFCLKKKNAHVALPTSYTLSLRIRMTHARN